MLRPGTIKQNKSTSSPLPKVEDNCALFDVPFVGGENLLEAVAVAGDSELRDMLRIQFQLVGSQLKEEFMKVIDIIFIIFKALDFKDFTAQVSLRDPKAWRPTAPWRSPPWGARSLGHRPNGS